MASNKSTGLPIIEESEATGEAARIYAAFKRELQLPNVPNMVKAMAASQGMLTVHWTMFTTFWRMTTFPTSLLSMIFYTVAEVNHCKYCSAGNEMMCRQLGIDEDTLKALVNDLGSVSPDRLRAIINFALKAANNPQGLVPEDYDEVRAQGVTDEEIIELIFVAAIATLVDTLADALKVELESEVVSVSKGQAAP